MGKHAKYSPSSGHRYMNCPPALLLEEQFPDEESPYAAEGTAGHKLAEHLIKKHLKIRSRRPTSDYYSDELLEAVDEYVQYVIEQIEEPKHICSDPAKPIKTEWSLPRFCAVPVFPQTSTPGRMAPAMRQVALPVLPSTAARMPFTTIS